MAKISNGRKSNLDSSSKVEHSQKLSTQPSLDEIYEETPFSEAFWTYLNYIILNLFGWFRDFLRQTRIENRKGSADNNPPVIIQETNQTCFWLTDDILLNILGFCSSLPKLRKLLYSKCISTNSWLFQSTHRQCCCWKTRTIRTCDWWLQLVVQVRCQKWFELNWIQLDSFLF